MRCHNNRTENPPQKIPQKHTLRSDFDVCDCAAGGGGSYLVHMQLAREQTHFEQGLNKAWRGGS
jgi:hypothetical protein